MLAPWSDQLQGDLLSWLLEPDTPGVRYLALRDLLDLPPDDPELTAARSLAHTEGPIATVLSAMDESGYWAKPGPGYNPKYRSTVWSLLMLAQLGASAAVDQRLARACTYLVDRALTAWGHFSTSGTGAPSGTIDCLQGNMCWALSDWGFPNPEWNQLLNGWRAASPERGWHPPKTARRKSGTTHTNAGLLSRAAPTTASPVPGEQSRLCWPSVSCLPKAARR